ncbi:MAG: hypothetical protein M1819_005686 [Sarea resinae]|nr:MAG: hypothetical protein M1819_005686 [Sarea resinae]
MAAKKSPAPLAASDSQFTLPSIKPVEFSLTAGTDIPPPPESPVEDTPPAPSTKKSVKVDTTAAFATPTSEMPGAFPQTPGAEQATEPRSPTSPASSTRPGSVRRFLSLKSLNTSYNASTDSLSNMVHLHHNQNAVPSSASIASSSLRPPSVASKRRSMSWFRRKSTGRNPLAYENVEEENRRPQEMSAPVPKGPPPPKLPELKTLGTSLDGGSLGGDDLFKGI